MAVLMAGALLAQTEGPAISVDAGAGRHAISPDIYGINDYSDAGLGAELRTGVRRWGGDAATRFNWQLDTYNAASDWYFENFTWSGSDAATLPDSGAFNHVMERARQDNMKTMGTIPMIGWLPKSRDRGCGFSVAKYGAQQKTDPYYADCGNGNKPDGSAVTGNDPNDVSANQGVDLQRQWVQYLVQRYGPASQGGVNIFSLDNEITIWHFVHRDVHPAPLGYDDLLSVSLQYAEMIKSVDPTAQVSGPVHPGWSSFYYSGVDWQAGWSSHAPWKYWFNPVDRNAHGGIGLTEWYLQQMHNYEARTGQRLLDYLDIHAYIFPDGVSFTPAGDAANQALRLEATRALWDPTYYFYTDDDPDEPKRLIPRMREWVSNNYPGTKLAVTEYNLGAPESINGALAQADVLGIFGREGLDLATMWAPPTPTQPAAFAFRAYRNYDGLGGSFGDTGVQATSANSSQLSAFAALRSDSAMTMVVINKTSTDLGSAVSLANFAPAATTQVWRYSAADLAHIVRQDDVSTGTSTWHAVFPANSITMLVVPAASVGPKPVINAVLNAASYATTIAPGTIFTIFGKNLGPKNLASASLDAAGNLSRSVSNVRVLFDGTPAPLIYVSDGQLAGVTPYVSASQPSAHIQVENAGSRSDVATIAIGAAAPGLFSIGATGQGNAAVINEDHSVNGPANPAPRGSVIAIYATGEGVTSVPSVDGLVAQTVLPKPVLPVAVDIGSVTGLKPQYAGAAPFLVAGALQVNVLIPQSVDPGNAALVVHVGDQKSQGGVTVAVR